MEPSAAVAVIETDLRVLTRVVLQEVDGPQWMEKDLDAGTLESLEARREEERKRRAPSGVPADLLGYTHLYELRTLIEKHWTAFAVALGQKREFAVLMDKVEDYRNAPAHSRELLPHERALLEGIAGEVRSKVTAFRSQRGPDASYYPVMESIHDSFGNEADLSSRNLGSVAVHTGLRLRPGDVVRFEARGWDPQGRELTWEYGPIFAGQGGAVTGTEVAFDWVVREEDVSVGWFLEIQVTSSGRYHRHRSYDDRVTFHYAVDPPDLS
jgi:hypothetical protein